MLNQIKKREVIDDLEYIEILTREYDEINFEKNMIEVIKFVNEHNLSLFTGSSKKLTRYGLGKLENKELDIKEDNKSSNEEIDIKEPEEDIKNKEKEIYIPDTMSFDYQYLIYPVISILFIIIKHDI